MYQVYLYPMRRGGAGRAVAQTTFIAGSYILGLQMAHKCKINGETLSLTFVYIDQIF